MKTTHKKYNRYGAAVSYVSELSSRERLRVMQLDDDKFDQCVIDARVVALKAINKMMKGVST